MYAITRSLIRSPGLRQGIQKMQTATASQISMKIVPAPADTKESYDEKNMRMQRALSPHLTIYKAQLTTILSLTHRATGCALSSVVWTLGLGALLSSHDVSHYVTMIEGLGMNDVTLTALKFIIVYPLAYHTCAGIRHLFWDTGKFLKMKEVYATGYATVFSSFVLAAVLALL